MKIIVVTGGVISGLGKGITAASLGTLMKASGYSVTMMKLDPYLQIDAGTMSPFEHGETFVTQDGFETDLDLGHYERFIDENLTRESSVTTGQIYLSVIQKEREGKFLGETVQVIPHVTNEVKERILSVAQRRDITIIEVGGTIGDIEGPHFIEALRQLRMELGKEIVCFVHVVPIITVSTSGELKTKAIQHSVTKLREMGLHANFLVCRTVQALTQEAKAKMAMFCDLDADRIIEARDEKSIYRVPVAFYEQDFHTKILQRFGLATGTCDLQDWNVRVNALLHPEHEVHIAIAGKYTQLDDSYLSVVESLKHAGSLYHTKVTIHWLNTETLEGSDREVVFQNFLAEQAITGILVPGGFGNRGIEGMIFVADYARKHKIPYLGICLGMQVATIAFARSVCGLGDAHSTEFNPQTSAPVIDFLENQKTITQKGGTMRLGNYEAVLTPGTRVYELYGKSPVIERHRHRYEVNPEYHEILQKNGLVLSGLSPDGSLVEYIELAEYPCYLGTQAHPEFTSRLQRPHPLFCALVKASLEVE